MRQSMGYFRWTAPRYKTLFLAVLLLVSGLFLRAQEFRGTIAGHITDATGAVVPGATVSAVGPQQTYSATSADNGDFIIPFVNPATYTVSVERSGFKKEVRNEIIVNINSRINLSLVLQVGSSIETVTVSGGGGLQLDTEDASGGTIMDPEKVASLPLNGRQVYMLLSLTPGTQFTQTQFGSSGYSGTRGWDESNAYSINGVSGSYNQFSLNGAPVSTQNGGGSGTWNISPSVDAIEEFKVMSNTYDAQYGRYAGGTVNTQLKSGEKQYHGTAFDYWRNRVLDANTFDQNQQNSSKPFHNLHQFGGTIGGRAIPHHDRLFFFFSFEGWREVLPAGVVTSVPTPDMLPGLAPDGGIDLTSYLTYNNIIGPNSSGYDGNPRKVGIFDPDFSKATCFKMGTTGCSEYQRAPFPVASDGSLNTIPAADINASAVALYKLFPQPNRSGYSSNYINNESTPYKYNMPIVRVDYNFTDATKISGSFAWWSGTENRNSNGYDGPLERGDVNNYRSTLTQVVDTTHTFSPRIFGDLRIAFNRSLNLDPNGSVAAGTASLKASDLGLTMPAVPTTARQWAPEINTGHFGTVIGNQADPTMFETYDLSPSITHVMGHHNLHYGVEYMLFHDIVNGVGQPNGAFAFGGGFVQQFPNNGDGTGSSVAGILVGYPSSGSVENKNSTYESYKYYAGYFQDDWKIAHNLTINAGLRWDTETSPVDRNNYLMAGICLTCANTELTNSITYPADVAMVKPIVGVARFASSKLTAYENTFGLLQPKIGVSYALNNKLVVRGGWGLGTAVGIELGGASAWDRSTSYDASTNNGMTPTPYFHDGTPFPNGISPVLGNAQGDQALVGDGQGFDGRDRKIVHAQQYSFGIQGELPGHIIGDLEYVGTYTTNLRTSRELNGLSDSDVAKGLADPSYLDEQVTNPFYGVLPATEGLGQNQYVSRKLLLVPYPQFNGELYEYTHADGYSNYNSMIAKAEKRLSNGAGFSRGLSFLTSFTWAKLMSATGYLNNANEWKVDAKPSYHMDGGGNAPTWQLSFSGLYGLPVGKGAWLLPNAHGVLGQLVNDWQLDWIFQNRAGWPIGIPTGDIFGCGTYNVKPSHRSWGTYLNNSQNTCWSNAPEYYIYTFDGTQQKVRDPWAQQTQLAMEKKFALKDQLKMEFKAEAFNATNTPQFGGPSTSDPETAPVRNTNIADPNQPGAWSGYGTVGSTQQNFPRQFQFSLRVLF